LTLSSNQGNVLRLSEIAHEEHVPRERFVDGLERLARKMGALLEIPSANETKKTQIPLQSVLEEDECQSDDDDDTSISFKPTGNGRRQWTKRTRVI